MNIEVVDCGIVTRSRSTYEVDEHGKPVTAQHGFKDQLIDIKVDGVWVGCYVATEDFPGYWTSMMQVEATWRRFQSVIGSAKDVEVEILRTFAEDAVTRQAIQSYVYNKGMEDRESVPPPVSA